MKSSLKICNLFIETTLVESTKRLMHSEIYWMVYFVKPCKLS